MWAVNNHFSILYYQIQILSQSTDGGLECDMIFLQVSDLRRFWTNTMKATQTKTFINMVLYLFDLC